MEESADQVRWPPTRYTTEHGAGAGVKGDSRPTSATAARRPPSRRRTRGRHGVKGTEKHETIPGAGSGPGRSFAGQGVALLTRDALRVVSRTACHPSCARRRRSVPPTSRTCFGVSGSYAIPLMEYFRRPAPYKVRVGASASPREGYGRVDNPGPERSVRGRQ